MRIEGFVSEYTIEIAEVVKWSKEWEKQEYMITPFCEQLDYNPANTSDFSLVAGNLKEELENILTNEISSFEKELFSVV